MAVVGACLVGPAPASADSSDKSRVRAETTRTAALAPGQSGWLSVVWTADLTVTDWSTTVAAPEGVTVTYPSTRGGHDTSLYGSAVLVGTTRDFTAFRLSVPYTQTRSFRVTLTSTYRRAPGNGAGQGNPKQYSVTASVTVPVEKATGPAFTQDTTTLTVPAGSSDFRQISFTGGRTDLADFTVRFGTLPPGLEVAYPGDRSSSGLNAGGTLVGGTTDHVAVRLIATALDPGRYTVPITIAYRAATPQTATGEVILDVA
jgi:hypothetical protein